MKNDTTSSTQKKKQILAIIGLTLIGIMVIATIVTACIDPTGLWFRSCLFLTIALPILIWVCIWLYGIITQKHTSASIDLLNEKNTDAQTDYDK